MGRMLTPLRTGSCPIVLAAVIGVVATGTTALAQFPGGGGGWGGGGGGWGGGGGGRRGGGGFDPNAMWDRMDANSNGILEPEEMQGRARGFLERMAGDAGLDLSQPIPLADIKRIMQERFQRGGRGGGGGAGGGGAGGWPGGGPGGGETAPATSASSASAPSATAKADLQVPGFGVTEDLPPVPGFGDAAPGDKKGRGRSQPVSVAVATASGGAKSGSSGFSYASAPLDAKILRYAEGMLKQYDANKDGMLQKEEWSKMRGDPNGADKNGDEILTKEEVAEQLANYGKKQGGDDKGNDKAVEPKSGGSPAPVAAGAPAAPPASNTSGSPPPHSGIRFLTPTERLPKGLPTWFAGKDSNGDGQVLMAEYASTWSDSKVAEFDKYDLNGDGVITAKECLRAEKK